MPLHNTSMQGASRHMAESVAVTIVGTSRPPVVSLDDEARDVGTRTATGAVWVSLAIVAGRTLGLVTNLILARILSPDDFGLVSFAMILIGAFTVLQDLGVPASIVYSKRDIRDIGATALTINVTASVLLFGTTLVVAPFLARMSGEDGVAPIAVVLAIGLLISSFGSVQRALLDKHLAFRRKFVPEIVPLIGSGLTSVILALNGFGAWSLVGGYLVKSGLSTLLLWSMSSVRPLPRFQRSVARDLLSYGKHVSLTAIVGFIGVNADYFIVGHSLGTYDLGLYVLAFTIANMPCAIIGQVVTTVMFPAYTHIREDRTALIQLFEDVFIVVSVLAVPAGIGIWVAGPAYVPIVFGERWAEIREPLRILAIYGVLRTISMGFAPIYKAIGRPGENWRLNLIRIAILVPLMLYLIRYGLIGIGIAYVVISVIFIPMNALRLGRFLRMTRAWFFRLVAPQLVSVSVAVIVILVWDTSRLRTIGDSEQINTALLSIAAIIAYLVAVIMLNPRALHFARSGTHVVSSRLRMVTG